MYNMHRRGPRLATLRFIRLNRDLTETPFTPRLLFTMKTTGAAEARVPVVDLRVDHRECHDLDLSGSVSARNREGHRPNHCRPVTPNRAGLRELAQSVLHARLAFDTRRDSAYAENAENPSSNHPLLSPLRGENYESPPKCEGIHSVAPLTFLHARVLCIIGYSVGLEINTRNVPLSRSISPADSGARSTSTLITMRDVLLLHISVTDVRLT